LVKSYVGLVVDHSGSMKVHRQRALDDYNDNLGTLRESARETGIQTLASVVRCGVGFSARVELAVSRANVLALPELRSYPTDGTRTPLWDSVGMAIDNLELAGDPEGVYLIAVTTDGQENASESSGRTLRQRIQALQATDRWSFTFRVPRGYARALVSALDVDDGNVLEWEQTEAGFSEATHRQQYAISAYYAGLRGGQTKTTRFYSNLGRLDVQELQRRLRDVSDRTVGWLVLNGPQTIQESCEEVTRTEYRPGRAYYQLVKPSYVQEKKRFLIRDRKSGAIFAGSDARDILGLPRFGAVRLIPKKDGSYELFVQSMSRNRKLLTGSRVIYLLQDE